MFDYIRLILFATSVPILVNIARRDPYSWPHTMLLAICLAILSSTCAIGTAMFIQPSFFSSLRNLPTATQKPIWTRLFKEPTSRDLARFHEQTSASQLLRYFGVLNSERLLLTDPKDIKQVMDSEAYEFGRSYLIRRLLSPVLGKNSLVVTDGPDHMRCRKIENARLLVEDITTSRTGTDGQVLGPDNAIDVLKWLEKAAFRLVFIAFFGSNASEDHSLIQDLLQEFRDAFGITSGSSAQAYTPASRALPDKNILDTAIKSEDLSDDEILDLCTTFLATGYKTVSVALAWAIYHLSTRPGVQALLRTEVRASFPAPDQTGAPPLTSDLLQDMPVLAARGPTRYSLDPTKSYLKARYSQSRLG
ncbi:cytochrome P450, partial [Aureobasidium melanogenum]